MDELKKLVKGEQHRAVIAAANKLIAAAKGNAHKDVVEAKVVALLQESKVSNSLWHFPAGL